MADDTFCHDSRARRELERIRALVVAAGYEVTEADYLLNLFANGAARLDEIAERVGKERNVDARLRLMGAERLARGDMARLIDQLERHYAGVEVQESAAEVTRTGTDGNVVEFAPRLRSVVSQRIVAVLARTSSGLTRGELQRKVAGSQPAFLAGLKEAVSARAVKRTGAGRKNSPHRYWSA